MEYFSDKEHGSRPRASEEIPINVWNGIVVTINSMIDKGGFGESFPETCLDGNLPIGTDRDKMALAVQAEIPGITWPLECVSHEYRLSPQKEVKSIPDTSIILDLIEFCYNHCAEPIVVGYHPFHRHNHLRFDVEQGKDKFLDKINTIFSRNGIAYELQADGEIVRLIAPVFQEKLTSSVFDSQDADLNKMLDDARHKILNHNPVIRYDALEKLWDAWERLKSIKEPSDKKASIARLLELVAPEENMRDVINEEACKLTTIGNSFHIRHHEVGQTRIDDSDHVDYLFYRLFALVWLCLRKLR